MTSTAVPPVTQETWLGHPKGLFLLFATEMWERFSYYGMRALLVLSLIAGVEAANPGFGWSQSEALKLYGLFTGFVYFTPLIGGWLADNYLGQRKSVIIGGLLMAVGQFTLAAAIPGNLNLFYVGLVILVLGNGFFKPNISTMVGDLYEEGDARRDGAFTIFYMGINAGAFLAPLVCSTLGEDPGPRLGLRVLRRRRRHGPVGDHPARCLHDATSPTSAPCPRPSARSPSPAASTRPLTPDEVDRLRVIFMLFIFVVLFWAAFEQAGGLMNIYANEKTDRMIGGFEVPAGWFQSLNPLFIVVLAPIFSAMWGKLGQAGRNPATPRKMVLGLVLTGIGFLAMVAAALESAGGGKAAMSWLVIAYFFHTTGELCISPVGLSMVTKLAPLRLASLMMGVWFLINFVANWLAGIIGSYAEHFGELSIFGGLAATLFIFAVVLWLLSGMLVRWMHGAEDLKHA